MIDTAGPDEQTTIALDGPVDLRRTVAPLRAGPGDPSVRIGGSGVWIGLRLADGPTTLQLRSTPEGVVARAWGPGAAGAMAVADGLVGAHDHPEAFVTSDPRVRPLHRARPGLRFARYPVLVDVLVPVVLEQKVAARAAHRSWNRLVRAQGRPAPGPTGRDGLWIRPAPDRLAELGYAAFHPLGVERRRAEVIRAVARRADALDALVTVPAPEARARLEATPGIGPWTSAMVTQRSHGDADAVVVGDLHLPGLVGWALAGEAGADDARMLDLLAPFAGHRARVVRLLAGAGAGPPRRAPRARLVAVEHL